MSKTIYIIISVVITITYVYASKLSNTNEIISSIISRDVDMKNRGTNDGDILQGKCGENVNWTLFVRRACMMMHHVQQCYRTSTRAIFNMRGLCRVQ